MEGPMFRRNGVASMKLQPIATHRSLGSTLLDLSILQLKLEIQQLIHIMGNKSVWVNSLG